MRILQVIGGSLKLGSSVDVALEGTVVDIGAVVVHEGHDRLVLGTVPLNVARLPETVPVDVLVVLMVDRGLSGSPLSVRVGHGRVLGDHAKHCPIVQIRVVEQRLGVELMVPKDDGAIMAETTTDTADDEEDDPSVGQPAANVEVLDGEFADHGEAEENTKLCAGGVVGPVEIGVVGWASNDGKIISGEPALEDLLIVEGLGGPLELSLLEGVFGDTEADQLTVLDVVSRLGVDSTSEFIVVGVLEEEGQGIRKIDLPARPGWRASRACICPRSSRWGCECSLRSYFQY